MNGPVPEALREEARLILRVALRGYATGGRPDAYELGRVSAFRQAAGWLRNEAARLEGCDVTALHGGPRSTELARHGLETPG